MADPGASNLLCIYPKIRIGGSKCVSTTTWLAIPLRYLMWAGRKDGHRPPVSLRLTGPFPDRTGPTSANMTPKPKNPSAARGAPQCGPCPTVRFQARFKPDCCLPTALAAAYPGLVVSVLGVLPGSDGKVLHDIEVEGVIVNDITEKIDSYFPNVTPEVLEKGPGRTIYRVRVHPCALFELFQAHGLPPNFPIRHHGESTVFSVTAPRPAILRFYQALRKRASRLSIATVPSGYRPYGLRMLTPKQLEVYLFARASGYWDLPRQIRLKDMAFMLGVSISSLSELLATIEHKILQGEDRDASS